MKIKYIFIFRQKIYTKIIKLPEWFSGKGQSHIININYLISID